MKKPRLRRGTFLILCIGTILSFLPLLQVSPVEAYESIHKEEQQGTFLEERKKIVGAINSQEKCNEVWNFYWYWVKKGNLRARLELALLVLAPPAPPTLALPGADLKHYSFYSAIKDVFPLAVHTMGVSPSDDDYYRAYTSLVETIYIFNNRFLPAERKSMEAFWSCWNKPQSEKHACIQEAVKKGVLPSFESFVKKIDQSLQKDEHPTCKSSGGRGN